MAVRQVDAIPFKEKYMTKRDRLVSDLEEIIRNRWEISELIDPPYSQSAMRDGILAAVRAIVWKMNLKTYTNPFTFITRTEDGKKKWFVRFDAEAWDKTLKANEGKKE